MKRILHIFLKSLGYFMLALSLYVLVGFSLSKISVNKNQNQPDEIAIYILTNGVHTDIVVPSKTEEIDWTQLVNPKNTKTATNAYPYLAFGWGDKGFYLNTPTWADLKFSTAFKAASGLSTSAMHTTYYNQLAENENCIKILVSKNQYKKLVSYIKDSFQINEDETFKLINTVNTYSNTDAFYEAKGSYSIFKTCNSWANSGLKHAEQKAALWTATDTGIFEKYQK